MCRPLAYSGHMAYPTKEELVAQSSGDARGALDALDGPQLTAVYNIAIRDVERYCKQSFSGTATKTFYVDGEGGPRVELPARLVELDELYVEGTPLDVTDVAIGGEGAFLDVHGEAVGNYYVQALRELSGNTNRSFPAGTKNVRVIGTFGWDEPPADVVDAIRMTMEDIALAEENELAATIRAYTRLGIASVRQGPLSVEIGAPAPVSARVADMLADYVWETSVGALI